MNAFLLKVKIYAKTLFQRLIITLQLYGENGLANHAAACAYGFLLSMAPMLLLIVFFIFTIFKPSGNAIASLISYIPFLEAIFDEQWLSSDFFTVTKPGISGIISVVSIFWAARILSISIQRGLKVIFPSAKHRNPVIETIITLTVEAVVIILVLFAIVSSRTALRFFSLFDFLPEIPIFNMAASQVGNNIFMLVLFGIAAFFIYLFVPVNSPRKLSAFQGALLCSIACFCMVMGLRLILNTSQYSFLYGTLGNIVVLLVNVYFFFLLFFLGAQFAYVIDSFDALLFSKVRQLAVNLEEEKTLGGKKIAALFLRLFNPTQSSLRKYLRPFKERETIISRGDAGDDIYYLFEGEVEIFLKDNGNTYILKSGSFFGEMSYLLSEGRTATVRAKTDVAVIVLPPLLFDAVLRHDKKLDRDIIEHITRRLKNANEQIASLSSEQ